MRKHALCISFITGVSNPPAAERSRSAAAAWEPGRTAGGERRLHLSLGTAPTGLGGPSREHERPWGPHRQLQGSHLKNLCRYWRLQADQEKSPLRPANVGDIMLPSDFLHTFPSPSWTMPKLWERNGSFSAKNRVSDHTRSHQCRPALWKPLLLCARQAGKGPHQQTGENTHAVTDPPGRNFYLCSC